MWQSQVVRKPDRKGIPLAIRRLGLIDLCHYDSDKTYEGRKWAYPLLWGILRKDGIFISDDIADNLAFYNFCKKIGKEPIIIKSSQNYVGIIIKK